eukprot:3656154-Rhodomonas_salina.1
MSLSNSWKCCASSYACGQLKTSAVRLVVSCETTSNAGVYASGNRDLWMTRNSADPAAAACQAVVMVEPASHGEEGAQQ